MDVTRKKSRLRLSFFVIIKEEGLRKTPTSMRKWMNKKATSSFKLHKRRQRRKLLKSLFVRITHIQMSNLAKIKKRNIIRKWGLHLLNFFIHFTATFCSQIAVLQVTFWGYLIIVAFLVARGAKTFEKSNYLECYLNRGLRSEKHFQSCFSFFL